MPRGKNFFSLLLFVLSFLSLSYIPVTAQELTNKVFIPLIAKTVTPSMFGFEIAPTSISDSRISSQAQSLGAYWIRLNGVEWAKVEPVRGTPYNWNALVDLDRAINKARELGMNPVVIVRGTPLWASVTNSNCAAIKDEYLADFTNFMSALVYRYKNQVIYWELGNEPDVDPLLVPSDYPFGCWGDIQDPYYGGERYGRMLQAVAPAMRAANPNVKIVIGGLLLDRPNTTDPLRGKPENFLEGILRANAANSFDIVAYHTYPSFFRADLDHDRLVGLNWYDLGGMVQGKALFLRNVMARYGVNKPLWLNETSLVCTPPYVPCEPPIEALFPAQANHLIKLMGRAAGIDIQQVMWYTLEGPGWRSGSLLDGNQQPRPSYNAYKRLISLTEGYRTARAVTDYGVNIEAYRFVKANGVVDVLWSNSGSTEVVEVPNSAYRSAVLWDGTSPPMAQGTTHQLIAVGFDAILLERTP